MYVYSVYNVYVCVMVIHTLLDTYLLLQDSSLLSALHALHPISQSTEEKLVNLLHDLFLSLSVAEQSPHKYFANP